MTKKIYTIFSFLLLFFLYNCQSPTTVVDEGNISKGMSRKDMKKSFRFKLLGGHNPFKGECFHEYYPQKKMEIISGSARVLVEIDSDIEAVFYVLEDVQLLSLHRN